jgi:hypothetical protein
VGDVPAALGAEFFEFQLVFVLFFILLDAVVDVFAIGARKFDVLFGNSRHGKSL